MSIMTPILVLTIIPAVLFFSLPGCTQAAPSPQAQISQLPVSQAIHSGDTIALQTTIRFQWMSCFRDTCATSTCPRIQFTDTDLQRCGGEVFQIYRMSGPGEVRVGDRVGIHYKLEPGKWLGCADVSQCSKKPCPGNPTLENGFSNVDKWSQCFGEVFQIYARGRNDGDIINNLDDIRLFYSKSGSVSTWLSWWEGDIHRSSCPSSNRPPTIEQFEHCFGELFKIHKQETTYAEMDMY